MTSFCSSQLWGSFMVVACRAYSPCTILVNMVIRLQIDEYVLQLVPVVLRLLICCCLLLLSSKLDKDCLCVHGGKCRKLSCSFCRGNFDLSEDKCNTEKMTTIFKCHTSVAGRRCTGPTEVRLVRSLLSCGIKIIAFVGRQSSGFIRAVDFTLGWLLACFEKASWSRESAT